MDPNYKLKVNPIQREEYPRVGNLLYDELGQLVLAKLNERFRRVPCIEFTQEFKKDQPITHSNVPRVLAIDQILREEGLDIHVLSPEEVIRYWSAIPERRSTYSDTNSVIIYPKEGPNEELRQKALKLIGKQSTKIPLVISGLGVEKADNQYGFTFTQTGNILVREASYLTKDDCKAALNKKGELVKLNQGVQVWTSYDQSGFRRLYRNSNEFLDCRYDAVLGSNDTGRVVLINDVITQKN